MSRSSFASMVAAAFVLLGACATSFSVDAGNPAPSVPVPPGNERVYQLEILSKLAGRNADAPFRRLVDQCRELGLNAIKLDLPWRLTEIERGRFDWSRIDAQLAYVISKGMKASIAISLRELPEWLVASRQEGQHWVMENERGRPCQLFLFNEHFYIPSFHMPALRDAVTAYHRAIAEHFRAQASVRSAILYYLTTWTPSFESEYPWLSYCDYSDAANADFQQFLEQAYGRIDALNYLWSPERPFEKFSDVSIPAVGASRARPDLAPAIQDWFAFRTEALRLWIRACRDGIKSGDPDAPYGIQLSVTAQEGSNGGCAKRGTYAFPRYAEGLEWLVVDDAPDTDHAFTLDNVRATLPGTKIVSEFDGPWFVHAMRGSKGSREAGLDRRYFEQGSLAWDHGAHGVEGANWSGDFDGKPPDEAIADWSFFKRLAPLAARPIAKPPIRGFRHVSVQELFAHHEDSSFIDKILREYARDSRRGAIALDVVYDADQLVADSAEGRDAFEFSKDFAARQGAARWQYLELHDRRFNRLVWDGTANRWQSATATSRISKGALEPGNTDPVLLWVAPRAGMISLEAAVRKESGGGDGVLVELWQLVGRASERVLELTIQGSDTTAHPIQFRRDVKPGDVFAFRVGPGRDARYDRVRLDPKFVYLGKASATPTDGTPR